jgi:phosphinothricin acetyltransferase
MRTTIRLATVADAAEIASIYSHFVLNTPVSFESEAPDATEMARRIETVLEQYPWLVCDFDDEIAAYAYASQHRPRFHYQWSVDMSVYVHESFRRQGLGRALYTALLSIVPLQGYVSAFAGITLPNAGSVALHEAMGFTPVGIYKNVGYKLGKWHDVGWWQRSLASPPANPQSPTPMTALVGSPAWASGLESGVRLVRRTSD